LPELRAIAVRKSELLRSGGSHDRQEQLTVPLLFRDYETRSCVSLKDLGAQRYAGDPSTAVWCCAYAVDDQPVELWRPGEPVPGPFVAAANESDWLVIAHNDQFEGAIEQHILGPRHGWPAILPERHRCTQAMALACGLPAKLETVAAVLQLEHQKGSPLIMNQLAKPRRPRKGEDPNGTYWFEDQARLQKLYDYCRGDVEVERELFDLLPQLSPAEHQLWLLNNKINQRGFYVDRAPAEAARKIAEAAAPEIDDELSEITGGIVTGINQIARLQQWCGNQGCEFKSLDRDTITEVLARNNLPEPVRRALQLRLDGAQAALRKIDALLLRAGADDRVRGAFRFHGAATGRWAGEGLQPQNLKKAPDKIEDAVAAVATGNYLHVKECFPRPLEAVGSCTRAMICAAPGKVFIGADFNAIESRVLAWVAEEAWKLDAYRRFDATHDPRDEPYSETACRIYRVKSGTFTRESPERATGKTCDLAFGYAGSLGAFRKFSDAFTDEEVRRFCADWRAAHPHIKQFWSRIDWAAVLAVQHRGRTVRCNSIRFVCEGCFLKLILPSGRALHYPYPGFVKDNRGDLTVTFRDNAAGQFKPCRNGQGAWPGLWTENIVSGIARDLLAEAMLRLEAAGYPIVLHVHDEIVAEVDPGADLNEFVRLMTIPPAWALDLPIAARGWNGQRYVK
jgi:DNA polymerase